MAGVVRACVYINNFLPWVTTGKMQHFVSQVILVLVGIL